MSPILAPDRAAMLRHLQLLFGRALSGRIEISYIRTAREGEKSYPFPRFFDVGDLDEAADHAVEVNSRHGHNVYVGAALRRDDVYPDKTAQDADFLRLYALFADADTPEQLDSARAGYRERSVTPPLVVVTGRTPYTRSQFWWPLEEPIDDLQVARASLRGIATVLGTDPAVCTGKQLMRLGGSISWPKPDKPGRVLERTEVVWPTHAAPGFELAQIHHAFPPLEPSAFRGEAPEVVVAPGGSLGLIEQVVDGREGYAFRLVTAHLHEWMGTTGSVPSLSELYASVAPVFLAKADQVRPGRGPSFLRAKCADRLAAFERGTIPFAKDLDHACQTWADGHRSEGAESAREPPRGEADADLYEVLSIADLKALPPAEMLVDDVIPFQGLGFVYGPPGSFKSFLMTDLALSIAYNFETWLEKPIRKAAGSVLYIASEGAQGLSNRITAWQLAHGVESDDGAFHLIRQTLSFMAPADVDRLERTVAAHILAFGAVGLIFVDTVSRVLPGADENLQKDMTLFIAACDRLRERFGATVVGVHHTNKQGEMRGSTVFLGQGDAVFRVTRNEGEKAGMLTCEKQKEAEDGWSVGFEMETQSWLPVGRLKEASSLTVRWTKVGEEVREAGDGWPNNRTCAAALRAIEEAWKAGRPWSPHARSQPEGRFAVHNLNRELGLTLGSAKLVIEEWLRTGVIRFEVADRHSKSRGLRVGFWPEAIAETCGNTAETCGNARLSD